MKYQAAKNQERPEYEGSFHFSRVDSNGQVKQWLPLMSSFYFNLP
ncbi:TPA: hypothetical protein ACHVYW_002358 [Legionella pneumophila]|nr:hypothetical protein LPE509_03067 [Legionella pneumophila subsp. pneumophila LPE509]WBV65691.1 hypothetical protein PGH44_14860 [Legionella pneumophila]